MMKHVRMIIMMFTMLVTLGCNTEAYAVDTNSGMEAISVGDVENLGKSLEITVFEAEIPKTAIECFDVSSKQQIAVGSASSSKKTVCIYDCEGRFCYGYRFQTYGDIGVVFQNDDLFIYLVRSGIAFSIDKSGNIQSAYRLSKTEANTEYWKASFIRTEQRVGDTKYILKNNMGVFNVCTSSYSQLLCINSNGDERVLYDASTSHHTQTGMAMIYVCALSGMVVFIIVKSFVAVRKRRVT